MREESIVMGNRAERVLAYFVAVVIVISLASFVALLSAVAAGRDPREFTSGIWAWVTMLPLISLPIGFGLIVALLIVSAVRRSRAATYAGG
jgi:cation transport ATPase